MSETYEQTWRRSIDDPEGFWAEAARAIDWDRPWDRVRVARVIDRGLVRDYLAAREARDRDVRLVGRRT